MNVVSLGLRGKSFLLSLVLVSLAVVVSMVVAQRQLEHELVVRAETQLMSMAEVAALASTGLPADRLDQLADDLGAAAHMRITFIAEDGQVFGDSAAEVAQVSALENHHDRPEVIDARTHGVGIARRTSATVGVDMLYIARRATLSGTTGVVRCAMPLLDLQRAVDGLRMAMLAAGALSLLFVSVVSWWASMWLARPLRALVHATRRNHATMTDDEDEVGTLSYRLQDLTTALQRSVDGLTQERDRLEQLLAAMAEAVVAFDDQQRVMLMNPAARALWGDMLTIGAPLTIPADAHGTDLASLVLDASRGHPGAVEMIVAAPDGTRERQVAVRATTPVGGIGVVLIAVDVSDMRRLETLRRDFVANVSHELRTPCSVILANTETLLAGAIHDPVRATRFLAAINRHADRLNHLITDLLDLSRIEAGQQSFSRGPVVVGTIVAEALRALESRVLEKGLQVTLHIGDDAIVRGDDKALEQVFINLLDNAFRYTPAGGHIWVTTKMAETDVVIEVKDDGPGVAEQHLPRLFERFYRADRGRSRESGGTGLGLAIVKHLIEEMDGSIAVTQAQPNGLCFCARLPRAS
jgi:two-component system, OmpR family, phosphate regulon sensor histidine kinase PhoR